MSEEADVVLDEAMQQVREAPNGSRRFKRLIVPEELFIEMVCQRFMFHHIITHAEFPDLPKDAKYVSMTHDVWDRRFGIIFESSEWPEVANGMPITNIGDEDSETPARFKTVPKLLPVMQGGKVVGFRSVLLNPASLKPDYELKKPLSVEEYECQEPMIVKGKE